jgi:hypothetical protein
LGNVPWSACSLPRRVQDLTKGGLLRQSSRLEPLTTLSGASRSRTITNYSTRALNLRNRSPSSLYALCGAQHGFLRTRNGTPSPHSILGAQWPPPPLPSTRRRRSLATILEAAAITASCGPAPAPSPRPRAPNPSASTHQPGQVGRAPLADRSIHTRPLLAPLQQRRHSCLAVQAGKK